MVELKPQSLFVVSKEVYLYIVVYFNSGFIHKIYNLNVIGQYNERVPRPDYIL